MPDFFLHEDMCHQSCPQQFYKDENTHQCFPCHKDCLECSGPSEDNCDLCAKYFSVLYDGRCLYNCPAGTYYERKIHGCKGKDSGVHDQVMNPREPDGIMGFGQDQVGCGVCTVPAPELLSHPFPSYFESALIYFLNESFIGFDHITFISKYNVDPPQQWLIKKDSHISIYKR